MINKGVWLVRSFVTSTNGAEQSEELAISRLPGKRLLVLKKEPVKFRWV